MATTQRIDNGPFLAGVVFGIAAVTDFLDGYLARRWQTETILGAFLDTVADKLLVAGALLALLQIDRVWVWAALVIIAREFIVTGLRGLAGTRGSIVGASFWGKSKAALQYVAIAFAFARFDITIGSLFLDEWLMLAAVIVTIGSGWHYVAGFWDVVRGSRVKA